MYFPYRNFAIDHIDNLQLLRRDCDSMEESGT